MHTSQQNFWKLPLNLCVSSSPQNFDRRVAAYAGGGFCAAEFFGPDFYSCWSVTRRLRSCSCRFFAASWSNYYAEGQISCSAWSRSYWKWPGGQDLATVPSWALWPLVFCRLNLRRCLVINYVKHPGPLHYATMIDRTEYSSCEPKRQILRPFLAKSKLFCEWI